MKMRNDYPQLVFHYTRATKKIYNKDVWVPTLEFPKFRVLEDDLREMEASSKDYAYTVLEILKTWVRNHHLSYVPVNVFCGDFAFNKFKKVYNSETVRIEETSEAELEHSERMVAEMYISKMNFLASVSDIVNELEPLLSKKWLNLYRSGRYRKCFGKVLDDLCQEYGIDYARDYPALVGEIAKRGKSIRI